MTYQTAGKLATELRQITEKLLFQRGYITDTDDSNAGVFQDIQFLSDIMIAFRDNGCPIQTVPKEDQKP